MKALLFIFIVMMSPNLASARNGCFRLFESLSALKIQPIDHDSQIISFKKVRDDVEAMAIKNLEPSQIVKIPLKHLRLELESQILMLEKATADQAFKSEYLKELIESQKTNLKEHLESPITLETYYRLSLKTLLLIDLKVENTPQESRYGLTPLQIKRLSEFISGKGSDALFLKSFPKMREFFTEWDKSLKASPRAPHRVLIFSTLDLKIPEFNNFLSMDISFLGLVDFVSHPDGTPVAEGPRGFASHDLSHHQLYRSQHKAWTNSGFTIAERRQLMLEIRKNYAAARSNLDSKSQMSLDILFFEFFHEDTAIFPRYMSLLRSTNGTFAEPYNLSSSRVLNRSEVHGLLLGARFVFPTEIKESSLRVTGSGETSLHRSMKPSWELITEIWAKSYKSL